MSDEDYQKLRNIHNKLLDDVLNEEEEFKDFHKKHMDEIAESLKLEYIQLKEVEEIGSDIDNYTNNLDKILTDQMEKIKELKKRLTKFKNMIIDEETLAEKFQDKNELIDTYYLNNGDNQINKAIKVEENKCIK